MVTRVAQEMDARNYRDAFAAGAQLRHHEAVDLVRAALPGGEESN